MDLQFNRIYVPEQKITIAVVPSDYDTTGFTQPVLIEEKGDGEQEDEAVQQMYRQLYGQNTNQKNPYSLENFNYQQTQQDYIDKPLPVTKFEMPKVTLSSMVHLIKGGLLNKELLKNCVDNPQKTVVELSR